MDTIMIICDSVATCLKGTAEICQPCVKAREIGWLELGAIFLVCVSVLVVAIYGISAYYKDKEKARQAQKETNEKEKSEESGKSDKQEKTPEEKAMEMEIRRQGRVSDLMKEISELTRDPGISKDIKGKYNDTEAHNLWELYKAIDTYNKA